MATKVDLGAISISLLLVHSKVVISQDEFRQCRCEDSTSEEITTEDERCTETVRFLL
jgi:hypothetical protein